MQQINKPIEITQQQINSTAALVLMIAFFSFLAGYMATHEDAQEYVFAAPDQTVYYQDDAERKEDTEKEYYAVVTGFGTVEAARQWQKRLKSVGVMSTIVVRTSDSVLGEKRSWYQLVSPLGKKKEESEQWARRIQKIVPTVSVECTEKKKGEFHD